ncbi:hypothetical protein AFV9_gp29 [Betalipothrixvirus uzonense]|uniref:Uncharacterized protein n=1 Tax=Betalipothrixvirus uzonense TaxID=512792 RepID=B2CRK6_9VIRU|nr:hypothetical protein AFV9_gp29 [Acidianus filamentous virus 9]ACB37263.1 hypothetical protein [Acidianus filamentous virus 9]
MEEEENKQEEEITLPEPSNKSETERILEETVNEIESVLPKNVTYVTGIITDDEMNLLIIKDGKVYVGKDEKNAKPVLDYAKDANPGYLINALYLLKAQLPQYLELWSGKLEAEARKKLSDIF